MLLFEVHQVLTHAVAHKVQPLHFLDQLLELPPLWLERTPCVLISQLIEHANPISVVSVGFRPFHSFTETM